METQVIFMGGIHGSGKSSLCQKSVVDFRAIIIRQRYLLKEVAEERGLYTWEEIGAAHFLLIEEAAWHAVSKIKDCQLVLFDCHYAIRTEKALRILDKTMMGEYVPDLDDGLVSIIGNNFKIRFVLIQTAPALAAKRAENRPKEILDIDNSFEFLVKAEKIEKRLFLKKVNNFGINKRDFTIISNNGKQEESFEAFKKFVYQGYA